MPEINTVLGYDNRKMPGRQLSPGEGFTGFSGSRESAAERIDPPKTTGLPRHIAALRLIAEIAPDGGRDPVRAEIAALAKAALGDPDAKSHGKMAG